MTLDRNELLVLERNALQFAAGREMFGRSYEPVVLPGGLPNLEGAAGWGKSGKIELVTAPVSAEDLKEEGGRHLLKMAAFSATELGFRLVFYVCLESADRARDLLQLWHATAPDTKRFVHVQPVIVRLQLGDAPF